jgi:hypothetical protein
VQILEDQKVSNAERERTTGYKQDSTQGGPGGFTLLQIDIWRFSSGDMSRVIITYPRQTAFPIQDIPALRHTENKCSLVTLKRT